MGNVVNNKGSLLHCQRKCDHLAIDLIYYIRVAQVYVAAVEIKETAAEFDLGGKYKHRKIKVET
jgi:hypothetical protein